MRLFGEEPGEVALTLADGTLGNMYTTLPYTKLYSVPAY